MPKINDAFSSIWVYPDAKEIDNASIQYLDVVGGVALVEINIYTTELSVKSYMNDKVPFINVSIPSIPDNICIYFRDFEGWKIYSVFLLEQNIRVVFVKDMKDVI